MVGHNYYRLKQIDLGGTFEYSPVQAVKVEHEDEIHDYPTVLVGELTVSLPVESAENAMVSIYNMQGGLVFESRLQGSNVHRIILPQMAAGQYLVPVVNGNLFKRTMVFKQ